MLSEQATSRCDRLQTVSLTISIKTLSMIVADQIVTFVEEASCLARQRELYVLLALKLHYEIKATMMQESSLLI